MEILDLLRKRLESEQLQLAQMISGKLVPHRRTETGQLVDETAASIKQCKAQIAELEAQIKLLEQVLA